MLELLGRTASGSYPSSWTVGLWPPHRWLLVLDTPIGSRKGWCRAKPSLHGLEPRRAGRGSHTAIAMIVRLQTWLWSLIERDGDDGQSTAEYALVLLGAAAVALLVVSWATKTNWIARLYNAVMESIVSKVT